jgi:putative membrane protein
MTDFLNLLDVGEISTKLPPYELHLDVYLIAAIWSLLYAMAFVRLAPKLGRSSRPSRFELTNHICAVLTFIVGSTWPIHDVSEKSMYFVHMIQHLSFVNLLTIFVIFSVPNWLARYIFVRKYVLVVMRYCTRFIPATIIFNLLIVIFHWPAFVDETLSSGVVHFFAHFAMVIGFIIVWMVVLSPVPELSRPTPLVQMIFLFFQSIIPTIPASFLTLGTKPLYRIYESLPKLFSMSPIEDQQAAGLIMKIGQGLLIWCMICVIWFSWSNNEKKRESRFNSEKANKLD